MFNLFLHIFLNKRKFNKSICDLLAHDSIVFVRSEPGKTKFDTKTSFLTEKVIQD